MQISFNGNYIIQTASNNQAEQLKRALSNGNHATSTDGKSVKLLTGFDAQDYSSVSGAVAKVFAHDDKSYSRAIGNLNSHFDKKASSINITA